jgi:hypothetical protein
MDKLLALGFDVIGGQIDRGGVTYGFVNLDGSVFLSPEGEELVKLLTKKPKKISAPDPVVDAPVADVGV